MANIFMQNDPEEEKAYRKMIISCVMGASVVVLVFLIALYANSEKRKKQEEAVNIVKGQNQEEEEQTEDDFEYGNSNIVSSDLDFWDMEDDFETEGNRITEEDEDDDDDSVPYRKNDNDKKNPKSSDGDDDSEEASRTDEEDIKDKLAVTDDEGNKTYYEILDTADKNEYDLENNLTKNTDGVAKYTSGGKSSKSGLNLDKNSGTVDFAKVKNYGIDFCMLRIGIRDAGTGVVSLDDKFVEYANGANGNNIAVGVYFDSSAVTEAEAVEEASFAVGAVGNFGIKYPIAINLCEEGKSTSSRDSGLSMKERTAIVKAFCDTVKQYNYKPVIKAQRGTLISKLNLEDLNDYDIWISDYNYPTDYPYDFTMWQYTNDVKVDGIDIRVPLDISFKDYSGS